MKLKINKNWLAVLTALVVLPASPVFADNADYRIDITDDAATSLQELEITEHSIGEGDTVSHQIFVDNHTTSDHLVQLKNIEVVKDSILLDKLNFEFINGTTTVPFTSKNFAQAYQKDLFTIGSQKTGDFTLKMAINSDLDNSYQGTSCTLRYTFEIINLNPSKPEPETTGNLPTTFGDVVQGLLPKTGEGKMFLTTLIGIIISLSVFLVGKRRREKEADQ